MSSFNGTRPHNNNNSKTYHSDNRLNTELEARVANEGSQEAGEGLRLENDGNSDVRIPLPVNAGAAEHLEGRLTRDTDRDSLDESIAASERLKLRRSSSANSVSSSIFRCFGISFNIKPDFRYDDFSSIDWARDKSLELRRRHEQLNSSPHTCSRVWYSISGWLLLATVGAVSGVVAGFIDISTEWLSDIKEGVCTNAIWLSRAQCCWAVEVEHEHSTCELWTTWAELAGFDADSDTRLLGYSFAVRYGIYTAWALVFAGVCGTLVSRIAPYAAGSGIPEVKTILAGFILNNYLSLRTLLVKAVGIVLAVSAGLSLGKEGPLVHIACCCGNALSYLVENYRINEASKREILSAAAAAGVAVAFGAPIGGVLFSLEEVSYYFAPRTLWRSFFAAMVAAVILLQMHPLRNEHIVKFAVDYEHPWHWFELIPFAILGLVGGLYGAFFNWANLKWCAFRKRSALGEHPFLEVLAVALLTSVVNYPNTYTRVSAASTIESLFSECNPGNEEPLCKDSTKTVILGLFLAALAKGATTIFTFGIKVPSGLFIPSMFVGASIGRIVGMIVNDVVAMHDEAPLVDRVCQDARTCITPGLYALVGAGAALGGVTRMTVSLVVILFELTGGLQYIPPLMLAILISKWVGDAFNREGIYDRHILLNGLPFLDNKDELLFTSRVSEVMQPRPATGKRPTVLPRDGVTVADLEHFLQEYTFGGFPIVKSREDLQPQGYLIREDARLAIDKFMKRPGADMNAMCRFLEEDEEIERNAEKIDAQREAQKEEALENGTREDASGIKRQTAARPFPPKQHLDLTACVHEDVLQVADTMYMSTVVRLFQVMGIRQLFVMRNGQLAGILTRKDVIRHLRLMTGHTQAVHFRSS